MNGILIINKPKGLTSHDVVSRVRRILHTKKVGHAGTLDPIATGVLVVLVGKATKLSDRFLCEKKRYRAGFMLGIETDTYDITGNILSKKNISVSKLELLKCIESFCGKITQVPPMYSAIKVGGKKLYELARRGITVECKPRNIEIYNISLCDDNTLDISCSKGTYIRSLIHDIGEYLGCGAVMTELTRLESGDFCIEDSVTLEDLECDGFEKCSISIDDVIKVPKVTVDGENERKIKNGNVIMFEGIDGECKVFAADGTLLCVATGNTLEIKPDIMLYEGIL